VVTFTPQLLYHQGRNPRYPADHNTDCTVPALHNLLYDEKTHGRVSEMETRNIRLRKWRLAVNNEIREICKKYLEVIFLES
jgi:hypothetical protein